MPEETVKAALGAIEKHLGDASKNIKLGFSSAALACLLSLLILFKIARMEVPLPFIDFPIPTPVAYVVLIMASIIFGAAATFHVFRAINLKKLVIEDIRKQDYLSNERQRSANHLIAHSGRLPTIFISPWALSGAVFGAGVLQMSSYANLLQSQVFGNDMITSILVSIISGLITSLPYLITFVRYMLDREGL